LEKRSGITRTEQQPLEETAEENIRTWIKMENNPHYLKTKIEGCLAQSNSERSKHFQILVL
jgi:hypothetical protein